MHFHAFDVPKILINASRSLNNSRLLSEIKNKNRNYDINIKVTPKTPFLGVKKGGEKSTWVWQELWLFQPFLL